MVAPKMGRRAAIATGLSSILAVATPALAYGRIDDLSPWPASCSVPGYREIQLTIMETSGSDIAVSPDGRTLIVSILGQLFQTAAAGGMARQLTSGPYFHSDPAFSPDGKRLAFTRDDASGATNVYVLNLRSGTSRQLSTEASARRPEWSPDGRRIAYLVELTAEWDPEQQPAVPTIIREMSSDGTVLRTIEGRSALNRSVFYLPDGSLAWSVAERTDDGLRWRTRVRSDDGQQLGSVEGWADRTTFARGRLLALSFDPVRTDYGAIYPDASLILLGGSGPREVTRVRGAYALPRIGVAPNAEKIVLSTGGGIQTLNVANGSTRRLDFVAPVRLHVRRRPELKRIRLPELSPAPPLVVRNARIVHVETGEVGPPSRIVVRDGRIASIEKEEGPSAGGATVLDAEGAFVVPGLIDLDVRLRYSAAAFPTYGITTIREFGGTASSIAEINARPGLSDGPKPRILLGGRVLEGSKPRWTGSSTTVSLEDVQAARQAVKSAVAAGNVALRPYATMTWEQQVAAAQEAHRLQVPVIGHGVSLERVVKGVTHGFDTLEHIGWGERYYSDVAQLLAATETGWMPTHAIMGGSALLIRENPERLRDERLRKRTPADRISAALTENMFAATATDELRAYVKEHLAFTNQLASAGGIVLVGTASPVQNTFHGASLHWEMELLARGGVPPAQVLRSVTSRAAQRLGLRGEIGTIVAASRADFLVVGSDPTADMRWLQSVRSVVLGGKLL